jgi:hypothetical protein
LAAEFYDASESLINLAHELIQANHGHLVEAKIKYLFRTGNWEVKKRDTWGQAKKVGKEIKFLTGYDFIITIQQDVWEQLQIEDRKALLDHELQHCSAGTDNVGNKVWYVQGHDLEDFHAIIRRHGLWSPALKKLGNMLNQTELQFEPPEQAEELPEISGRPDLKVVKSSQPSKFLSEGKEEECDPDDELEAASGNENVIDVEIIEDSDDQQQDNPDDNSKHGNTGTEG